jgi:eukaryotic-like serine/threonine-protein kinase
MTREMPGWWWALVALGSVKALAGLPGFVFSASLNGLDSPFPPWVYLTSLLVYLTLGGVLILGGRRDHRAVMLGGVFVLAGSLAATRGLAFHGAQADDLLARSSAVLGGLDPGAFRSLFIWIFAAAFPRDALTGRWRRVAVAGLALGAAGGAALFAISVWIAVDVATGGQVPVPAVLRQFGATHPAGYYYFFTTPLTLAGLSLIVVNTRAAGRSDQRRAEVFVAGLVLGSVPILTQAAAESFIAPYGRFMSQPTPRFWSGVVLYPLLYSGYAVAAYSVYVGQVLSVRLVVRRAVRYAFARATLVGLMLVPFLLLSWIVYQQRDEPLSRLLTGSRQVILLALVAGAALLLRLRRRLLSALDRHFFREQYDARHILASLIQSGRSAASLEDLAQRLSAEINRALHVSPVTLFVADERSGALRAVQDAAEPLPLTATLATLLKGNQMPMDVAITTPHDALDRLPAGERAWVARGGYHLLVPIGDGPDTLAGVIALGAKRSELPFSREDRWLLSDTASSAALAMESLHARSAHSFTPVNHATPHDHQDAAGECRRCHTVHPSDTRACPACGEMLRPAAVPLTLHGLRVDRRVGEGGMGVVYCATDTALRRQVAVKTLPAVSLGHARQLRREARAMAALSHPNLATIYAVDSWRGTPLLLVEFLHRGTLQDALRSAPLPVPRVIEMGVALAAALEHMHDRSTLHRDIKPSNIGFTSSGVPKLLDFGLAKILAGPPADGARPSDASTSANGTMITPSAEFLIGTPAYFSPELASLHPPDYAADLWALALTMYEALAGRNPMAAATTIETLERIATASIPRLDSIRADCPPAVALFFSKALSRVFDERPSSARVFQQSLQQLMVS